MPDTCYTLITGASEGLGKYLALECARRRQNLLLLALPGSGLPRLAAYIKRRYTTEVLYMEKDLSTEKSCWELYADLKEKGLPFRFLIHSAGIGGSFGFAEKDSHFYARQIAVNVTAPTLLTRLLVPDLRRHAPSFILNVSSMAGFFALKNKQVYGATKSYLVSFSRSLRRELKEEGIAVSVLCPGDMDTRWQLMMAHRLDPNWFCRRSVMHPATVARMALDGLLKNKELIIPGFWNKVFFLGNKIFPGWLTNHLTRYQMKKLKPVICPLNDDHSGLSSVAV